MPGVPPLTLREVSEHQLQPLNVLDGGGLCESSVPPGDRGAAPTPLQTFGRLSGEALQCPAAALTALAVASHVMGHRAFFIINSRSEAELGTIFFI